MRRLLFVSCNYASDYGPMVWGTYIRMRMLLEAATRAADVVDLLLFVAPDTLATADTDRIAASLARHWGLTVKVRLSPRSVAAHGGRWATLRGLFDLRFQEDYGQAATSAQCEAVRAAIASDTDLVVAHRLDAAVACIPAARGRVPVAINFDDLEHVARARRLLREPTGPRTWSKRLELRVVRKIELRLLGEAQRALVCSSDEADYLRSLQVSTPVEVLQNAVAFPSGDIPHRSDGRTLMFIGSYGYDPNIHAAEELITKIFPRVRLSVPDARLLIAGARAERLPSAKIDDPAIEILGFIDDVATVYRRADVACCAIRAGGGTRIKIIEASAWGLPTVSTALGAEGLHLAAGREIAIAETSDALADACIALLQAPRRATAMGAAARQRVHVDYARDVIVDRMADAYRRTVVDGLQRSSHPGRFQQIA